jgi:hypothetical protein
MILWGGWGLTSGNKKPILLYESGIGFGGGGWGNWELFIILYF